MNKLKAALILFMSLPTLLFGAYYRSNSLAQELEIISKSAAVGYPYYLVVENNNSKLFKDNTLIYEKEIDETKEGRVEREIDYQKERTILTYWEDNLPKKIEEFSKEKTKTIKFTYLDDQLIEKKEFLDDTLDIIITYYRGTDGLLNGMRIIGLNRLQTNYLFSEINSVFTFGESKQEVFSRLDFYEGNLIVQQIWLAEKPLLESSVIRDQQNNLVVEEREDLYLKKKIYNPKGLLISLTTSYGQESVSTKIYEYDSEDLLIKTVELIEEATTKKIERYFEDQVLVNQIEWIDDKPISSTRFLSDGTSIVTLFENGKAYVDVTYASDGKRVLSLEYRMGK
ncbi:MAG: hypothetical protein WDA17_01900 [Sphaerochaetaceae bacterium]